MYSASQYRNIAASQLCVKRQLMSNTVKLYLIFSSS